MKRLLLTLSLALVAAVAALTAVAASPYARVTLGAERTDLYLDRLRGRRVALLSNHTGLIDNGREHTLDMLLRRGIDVVDIFSPEHGFRGNADAGERVGSSVDVATGIPIVSLYDKKTLATRLPEVMKDVDVVVADIQDVGVRFYTYYISMLRLMNEAARAGKSFVVLDRPNPIGMMVDGPILDMSLKSGVGALPLPIAHGLTLGEMAKMIVGEKWLDNGRRLDLTVVPCDGYTHATRYELPVAPSPNLKSMKAIYLYPSTCLFEGTVMSLGRGTQHPFEIYGHPYYQGGDTTFTPRSMPGAKKPPLMDRKCHGRSLRTIPDDEILAGGVDLSYLLDAYRNTPARRLAGGAFFTKFFDLLYGRKDTKAQFDRSDARAIKESWAPDLERYRRMRAKYLLYPEK